MLEAEAAATLLERELRQPVSASGGCRRSPARRSTSSARSFELRPPDLARDGLGGALRKHVEVLRRLGHEQVELVVADAPAPNEARTPTCSGSRRRRSRMRSGTRAPAGSSSASVSDGRLELEVADDGVGFDPTAADVRSRRLG